jgi:small subunit ribosomal protein S16
MLSIRLVRAGKKHQPFFKIIVADKKRSASSSSFIEDLGFYNPKTKEKKIKADRVKYWLSQGAKASDTIHNLLVNSKVIDAKKIAVHKKKKLSEAELAEIAKKEQAEREAKKAAATSQVEEVAKTEETPVENA